MLVGILSTLLQWWGILGGGDVECASSMSIPPG